MDDYVAFKINTENAKRIIFAYIEAKTKKEYDSFMNDIMVVKFFDNMSRMILKNGQGG